MPNKFLQSDQIVLSCLLQKAQKPRQHALADEERRYGSVILRLPYRIMELHTIYLNSKQILPTTLCKHFFVNCF